MNHLLIAFLALAALSVLGEPTILRSIRFNKRRFIAGDEEDLRAQMTPEQHDEWQKRGLIAGDWSLDGIAGLSNKAGDDSHQEDLAAEVSSSFGIQRQAGESARNFILRVVRGDISDVEAMAQPRLEGELLGILSQHAGEDGADESAVEVLERLIAEREALQNRAEAAETDLQTLENEKATLQKSVDDLTAESTGLKSSYDTLVGEKTGLADQVDKLTKDLDAANKAAAKAAAK